MRIMSSPFRLWILSAFLLFSNSILAQQRTISGKVMDATTGQPVIGTTVSLKGSKEATQTNREGSYTISVPNSARALIFTTVGYESQDVLISGRNADFCFFTSDNFQAK